MRDGDQGWQEIVMSTFSSFSTEYRETGRPVPAHQWASSANTWRIKKSSTAVVR
jgi:hypothetical protein